MEVISYPYKSKRSVSEKHGYKRKIQVNFKSELIAVQNRAPMNIGFIHTIYLTLYKDKENNMERMNY